MSKVEFKENTAKINKIFGSYRFRIEGYSGINNSIGDSIESPEFRLCGYTWQLRIFPGGSTFNHRDYISFYLASKSSRVARASYKLCILNQIIGGEDEMFASSCVRTFEAKGDQVDGWGRDKFMKSELLKDPLFGFSVNDIVIFQVEITVFSEPKYDSQDFQPRRYNPNSLDICLKNLFNDKESSDIAVATFNRPQDMLYVHRCILMGRSGIFRAMLLSDMKESELGIIQVDDVEYVIMRELLHYLYTDKAPSNRFLEENGISLLCASLKYQIVGLTDICEMFISSRLEQDSVISILHLADAFGAIALKHKSIHYIATKAPKLFTSKDFLDLDEELKREAGVIFEVIERKKRVLKDNDKKKKFQFGCAMM